MSNIKCKPEAEGRQKGPVSPSKPLLSVSDVSKTYGKGVHGEASEALKDVSIFIDRGESVGLIGASGSGKSTLARIICGIEPFDEGSIEFDGALLSAKETQRKGGIPALTRVFRGSNSGKSIKQAWLGMQMIFQNPEASFSSAMSISNAVREGLVYHGRYSKKEIDKRVREAFDEAELPYSYANKRWFELSGGQCQRAAIARAIISKPKLIVCDEPTSALDVTVQARIMQLLEKLHAQNETAFLFITHDIELMSGFCPRAYRLDGGRAVELLES